MNWAPLRAVRDDRWKFIDAPRPELYDLATDPGEHRTSTPNGRRPPRRCARPGAATAASGDAMSVQTLDREAMEKLAALGYIGAGGGAPTADEPPASPTRRTSSRSSTACGGPTAPCASGGSTRRCRSCARWSAKIRGTPLPQLVLGSAYMGMGETAKAISSIGSTWSWCPTSAYAHQWMAICYVRLGDAEARCVRRKRRSAIDPRFSDARILKGRRVRGAGRLRRGGHGAADGRRDRPGQADDPARPGEGAGRGGPHGGGAGRVRRDSAIAARLRPGADRAGAVLAGQGDLRARRTAALPSAPSRLDPAGRGPLQPRQVLEREEAPPRRRPQGPSTSGWPERPRTACRRTRSAAASTGAALPAADVRPSSRSQTNRLASGRSQEPDGRCAAPSAQTRQGRAGRRPQTASAPARSRTEPHAELRLPLAVRNDLRSACRSWASV